MDLSSAAVRNRRAAYTAFAWVLAFLGWHVVWVATGLPVPSATRHTGAARVLAEASTLAVWAMTAVGVVLPLALARQWGRRIPRALLLFPAWAGCALLSARGIAGVADDIVRASGLLPDGLTGLTTEQTLGTAHPSAWETFASGWTDVLFVTGGLVFGVAAATHRRVRARDGRGPMRAQPGPA